MFSGRAESCRAASGCRIRVFPHIAAAADPNRFDTDCAVGVYDARPDVLAFCQDRDTRLSRERAGGTMSHHDLFLLGIALGVILAVVTAIARFRVHPFLALVVGAL